MRYSEKVDDTVNEIMRQYPIMLTDTEELITEEGVNAIYLNPFQELLYNCQSRILFCRGARALGKTSALAVRLQLIVSTLPRCTIVLLGCSVKQLFTRTAPNTLKSLTTIGHWVEGVHFFRGRAPKSANFPDPLTKPRIWENAIHFYNGAVLYLVSAAVTGSTNSMNIQALLADECKYLPFKKIQEETLPALRADPYPGWSKKNPMYLSQYWMSDGGITIKQREWEKEKDKDITYEVNDKIMDCIAVMKRAQDVDDKHGTRYTEKLLNSPTFKENLQSLRCQSKIFFNCTSMMNMAILGEDWFKQQKRQLPELVYRLGILGEEAGVDKSMSFYSSFDTDIHGYYPNSHDEENIIQSKYIKKAKSVIDIGGTTKKIDYETIDNDELSLTENNSILDVDVDPKKPFLVAFDWNKNVNTLCVGQERKYQGFDSLMIVRSFWVVNPDRIEKLVANFCQHYALHKCKEVVFYADATAKQGTSYASSISDQYRFDKIVERELRSHGWKCSIINIGSPMKHDIKYQFVNNCFAGKERLFPRINLLTNDYLLASLENAMIDMRMGKVHKYKGDEKRTTGSGLSEDGEIGSNNWSDMSDAFDVLLQGAIRYPGGYGYGRFGNPNVPVFGIDVC